MATASPTSPAPPSTSPASTGKPSARRSRPPWREPSPSTGPKASPRACWNPPAPPSAPGSTATRSPVTAVSSPSTPRPHLPHRPRRPGHLPPGRRPHLQPGSPRRRTHRRRQQQPPPGHRLRPQDQGLRQATALRLPARPRPRRRPPAHHQRGLYPQHPPPARLTRHNPSPRSARAIASRTDSPGTAGLRHDRTTATRDSQSRHACRPSPRRPGNASD